MGLFEDELRKAQQWRAQLDAQQQAEQAQRDYIARSAALEQAKQEEKPGGLAGVLAGIGETIGNTAKGIGDFFTSGAINAYGASGLKSLLEGKDYATAAKETSKNIEDFKKNYYNTDSAKDAYMKSAGTSLEAASTLSDFIPGSAAVKAGVNVAQGAGSGIAQELINNGENASLENALKGSAVGAAGSLVGSKVGGKLGQVAAKSPAKGIVGKALQSNIGRGIATGATSGATSGALASGLYGGDVLSGALEGAKTGAVSGGATSAIYGVAGKALNKVNDKILGVGQTPETPTNVLADQTQDEIPEGTRRRQTAMDWNDESLSGQAKKQNYLQKLGGDLQDAAQATKDSAVYGKLKGNTAQEMINKDAINNLRNNYGYAPDDYEQASKLSTAINKWYDNEIKSSGAEKVNTKLSSDLALPSNNTLPSKYEKAYAETINSALNMANAGDSNVIDKYSAAGLERAAKYLGEQEQKLRRTNMNGVDGRPDGDRAELADYYANARKALRNEVNSMIELDDITKNNLSKMLDDAGATPQAKKAILSANNFAEVKSNTSPLEDARTMQRQMQASGLKRGANADQSTNLSTQVLRTTGAGNLMEVVGKPIRSGAAGLENAVGKTITKVGDAIAGDGAGVGSKATNVAANIVRAANTTPNISLGPINMDSVVTNEIARQNALQQNRDASARATNQQIEQQMNDAKTDYNNAMQQAQATYQAAQTAQPLSQGAQTVQNISDAMSRALAAGDITAYTQLADLYKKAYAIYGDEIEAAQKAATANPYDNLTSSQVENINKLDTASNAIDELESLFNKAGGGQGLIGGNAANFLASLGLNSDVATYNSLSRGLVNQIGAAIGKTDSLNTEGEVNRALELIPKFTDDAQTAKNKLGQLRQMLQANKQTVYQNYGITA